MSAASRLLIRQAAAAWPCFATAADPAAAAEQSSAYCIYVYHATHYYHYALYAATLLRHHVFIIGYAIRC